ncbi:hypothetical protein ACFYY3_23935 [Streptomyces sp. NPDC001812]|uniref:Transposase n=1 Tax=Streptomyces cathayae TaxID=3031124 RepID=A0ABY8K9U9_9ACTN|nr:hypothetical protein [Streptomyces sp. HUAS 5]WGD44394.1 hypothetical protein PYS65_32020 [Streptomyces sp. HUAS 5]
MYITKFFAGLGMNRVHDGSPRHRRVADVLDAMPAELLTPADRRGLTPLFWSHVRPYGEVNLDMVTRLNLTAVTVPSPRKAGDQEPAGERTGA